MSRFNPINKVARIKNKPIPDDLWEEHRQGILQKQDETRSVKKTAEWITLQNFPGFTPRSSTAQLRTQMKIWQTPKAISTQASGSGSMQPTVVEDSPSFQETEANSANHHDNCRTASQEVSGTFNEQTLDADTIFLRDDFPSYALKRPSASEESDCSVHPRKKLKCDMSSSTSSLQTLRFHEASPKLGPAKVLIDGQPLYSAKPGEAQRIKLQHERSGFETQFDLSKLQFSADFLMANERYKEASPLYLILCKAYQGFYPVPKRKCLMAVVAHYRCATTGSGLRSAKKLLKDWLEKADMFRVALTAFEQWLLRIMLLQVLLSLYLFSEAFELFEEFETATAHDPSILRALGVTEAMRLPVNAITMDKLIRCTQMMFYLFESEPAQANLATICSRFKGYTIFEGCMRLDGIASEPYDKFSSSWFKDIQAVSSYFRRCLHWIGSEIKSFSLLSIGSDWKSFRRQFPDFIHADTAMIFYFLASKWMTYQGAPGKRKIEQKNSNPESSPRVADLEVLKILSAMTMEESTTKKHQAKSAKLKSVEDKVAFLLKRAKLGIKSLMKMPDKTFARRVLGYFDRFLHTDTWHCLEPNICYKFVAHSIDFLPSIWELGPSKHWRILQIDGYKPDKDCACKDGRSDDGSCSVDKKSAPRTCLAESLSGSEMSSMRKMSWRAANKAFKTSPSSMDQLSESLRGSTIHDRDQPTQLQERWRPPVERWRSIQRIDSPSSF
ncbi:hypothetical protein BT63DRAFT_412602 [Microthyrium microscopicum]|uniref:Uncharacterized protein n=1 Tax=Microthyrium microscopicum TaxID=703497 RepID=A0A6A6UD62_9PEZI|nr:hypothetical protein BT63DRAFT_412602 [Microthyrium microscopicum]